MLEVKNIQASIDGKVILKDINLVVNPGELHVIMGPNGSGKSTLSDSIVGRSDITLDSGSIEFQKQDLAELKIDERARLGIFKSFLSPGWLRAQSQ